jgi:hypothetical protein
MLKKNDGSSTELNSSCNLPAPLPEKAAVLAPVLHKSGGSQNADFAKRHREEKAEIGFETRLAVGGLALVSGAGLFGAGVALVVGGGVGAVGNPIAIAAVAGYLAKNLRDGAEEYVFINKLERMFKTGKEGQRSSEQKASV